MRVALGLHCLQVTGWAFVGIPLCPLLTVRVDGWVRACCSCEKGSARNEKKEQHGGAPHLAFLAPLSHLPWQARFAEDAACQWRWFRQPAAAGGKKAAAAAAGEWAAIEGAFKLYTPQPEDAGHLLRVECTPGRRWASQPVRMEGD